MKKPVSFIRTLSFFCLCSLPSVGLAADNAGDLKGTWLIKEGLDYPSFVFARNGAVFVIAVDEECIQQDLGACKNLALEKLREDLLAKPYLEELSKQNYMHGEIVFKLRAHEGATDFAYHLKREGDKLVGHKKDISFKSTLKHFFVADPVL